MHQTVFAIHEALENEHWWFVARRKIIFSVLDKLIDINGNPLILDLGCGTGRTVFELSNKYKTMGVDISPIAIEKAKRTYPSCDFRQGEIIETVRESRDNLSCLLLMDVLEHIEEDEHFLDQIISSINPKTKILITVPAKMQLWSHHDVVAGHFRRYEIDSLHALWKNKKVNTRLLTYYNTRLYPIIRVARMIKKHMKTSEKNPTDFFMPSNLINRILIEIFSGETKQILNKIDKPVREKISHGVSLIAVLETK